MQEITGGSSHSGGIENRHLKAEGQEAFQASAPPTAMDSASLGKTKAHTSMRPLALAKDRAALPETEASGVFTGTRACLKVGERSPGPTDVEEVGTSSHQDTFQEKGHRNFVLKKGDEPECKF